MTSSACAAGKLSGSGGTGDTDADGETFGVVVLSSAVVPFSIGRVKEEASTPHARLGYSHLQNLLADDYRLLIAT
jgi:hypothetical protein